MTVRYAVTFEFESRPPVTARGTIAGSRGATCVARATREAQKALRPIGWSSLVVVLLERLDGPAEPLTLDAPADGMSAAPLPPREAGR